MGKKWKMGLAHCQICHIPLMNPGKGKKQRKLCWYHLHFPKPREAPQ